MKIRETKALRHIHREILVWEIKALTGKTPGERMAARRKVAELKRLRSTAFGGSLESGIEYREL